MKRPCLLQRRWPWLAFLLVPFAAWGVILAVVPTDWARARLVDRLTRATGRSVKIGALKLGLMGELRIIDLSIAENQTATDPWLKVAEARMDVHLGQILTGHCEPSEIEVDAPWVRIWRKPDGSLEIVDLLKNRSQASEGRGQGKNAGPGPSIALRVTNGRIKIIDDASRTLLDLTNVSLNGVYQPKVVTLEELRASLNSGKFAMAGKLDRDPISPRFEAEFKAEGIEIDRAMPALGDFVPVVAGGSEAVGGKLGLILALKGHGTTRAEIQRSLKGKGSIVIAPVDLQGSKFLKELDTLGDWPKETRIGSVSTDFTVANGRISTDDLTIRASNFPFVLGGWTDFDGRFDYRARVDRMSDKMPREAKGWLLEMKLGFDQLAGLRMRGTVDRCDVTINGQPLSGDPSRPNSERARFRETARQIRDRFFR